MATESKLRRSPSQPTGCWIRPVKRLAVYLRDGMRCVYCCADMHGAAPADITLDHLICRADGGTNHHANLITACRSCNCSRQDKPVARFCGPATRADIRRLTRRDLKPYLKLAAALISGETGDAAT
jgi:5-methylcytosine-specific restriction endonuclease McrA